MYRKAIRGGQGGTEKPWATAGGLGMCPLWATVVRHLKRQWVAANKENAGVMAPKRKKTAVVVHGTLEEWTAQTGDFREAKLLEDA